MINLANFARNSTRNSQKSFFVSAVCPPGSYYNKIFFNCKPCEKKSYQPNRGTSQCFKCPDTHTTFDMGSTSMTQCIRGKMDYISSLQNKTFGYILILYGVMIKPHFYNFPIVSCRLRFTSESSSPAHELSKHANYM